MRLTMKARQEVTKATAGQYRGARKKELTFVSRLIVNPTLRETYSLKSLYFFGAQYALPTRYMFRVLI